MGSIDFHWSRREKNIGSKTGEVWVGSETMSWSQKVFEGGTTTHQHPEECALPTSIILSSILEYLLSQEWLGMQAEEILRILWGV